MRGGSSLRNGSSCASSPSRSRRAPRRPRSCSSAASASTRRCSRTSRRRHRPCTSTSSASGPATSASFAAALAAKAVPGVLVRIVVDEQGSKPYDASRELYERLRQPGCRSWSRARRRCALPKVCSVLAAGSTRWNLDALGTSTTARPSSSTGDRVVGGAGRITSTTGGSTISSSDSRARSSASFSSCSSRASAGSAGRFRSRPRLAVQRSRRPRAMSLPSSTTLLAATAPSPMRSPS